MNMHLTHEQGRRRLYWVIAGVVLAPAAVEAFWKLLSLIGV
jgi:hypothetical protein